jgi:1,4-alpha-glucan branching enzyme
MTVAGDFNNWNAGVTPLTSEGNGFWSVDVATAKLSHQYKFVITNTGFLVHSGKTTRTPGR